VQAVTPKKLTGNSANSAQLLEQLAARRRVRRWTQQFEALKRPGGTLVISGFDESEESDVHASFARLRETARLEEASWVALRLE
jgi:hypothetical protein